MEIERQFLVDSLPPLPTDYDRIRQGYISLLPDDEPLGLQPLEAHIRSEAKEIRIRQICDHRFTLTVKHGTGLVREEWETDISRDEFESLAGRLQPDTLMIEKRRYRISLSDGLTAELHVHEGHLAGFNYAEVEFATVEDAKAFMPPMWFGREVTDDVRFSYGTLARSDGMAIVRQILRER